LDYVWVGFWVVFKTVLNVFGICLDLLTLEGLSVSLSCMLAVMSYVKCASGYFEYKVSF